MAIAQINRAARPLNETAKAHPFGKTPPGEAVAAALCRRPSERRNHWFALQRMAEQGNRQFNRAQNSAFRTKLSETILKPLAMKGTFLLLLGLLLSVISAKSESLVFGEGAALGQIASGYNIYRITNGKEPQSWADIQTIFNSPLNEINKGLQPTTRYAFLDKPFVLPRTGNRVVILSRSPAHDQYKMRGLFGPITGSLSSSLCRYAVVVSEDGKAGVMSFPETTIQQMFSEARIALPTPDPLGPRAYETANRTALFLWIGFVLLLAGISGRFVILLILKKAIAWQPT